MDVNVLDILDPVVELVFVAAAAAIAVIVPFAINWFLKKMRLEGLLSDQMIRGYLEPVIDRAIALAREKVDSQKVTVNVNNAIGQFVFEYLKKMVPDALTHFGLTEAKITDLVAAKIAQELNTPVSTAKMVSK